MALQRRTVRAERVTFLISKTKTKVFTILQLTLDMPIQWKFLYICVNF